MLLPGPAARPLLDEQAHHRAHTGIGRPTSSQPRLHDVVAAVAEVTKRPSRFAHGCVEPCGRGAAGYCPQSQRTNPGISTASCLPTVAWPAFLTAG
ncbi:hypothetical protein GCM10027072_41890 [Streptomyces bullii]